MKIQRLKLIFSLSLVLALGACATSQHGNTKIDDLANTCRSKLMILIKEMYISPLVNLTTLHMTLMVNRFGRIRD